MAICRGRRKNGKRCRQLAMCGQSVCRHHGGSMYTVGRLLKDLKLPSDLYSLFDALLCGPIVTSYRRFRTDVFGNMHGKYITYFANGKKRQECNYRYGKRHGKAVIYSSLNPAQRLIENNYRYGKLHGIQHIFWYGSFKKEMYVDGKEYIEPYYGLTNRTWRI